MIDDTDYSDHPESITETKANKARSSKEWTPRDALIHTLRMLDSGKIKPENMAILWTQFNAEGDRLYGRTICSPDTAVTIGMIEKSKVGLIKELYE